MPDSSRRSLTQPIWRAFQVALAAILGSAILIVGLTRTQVGRDNIQQQVENAFNQRFKGTLSIGELKGNVISDLVATRIQLHDPSGDLVVSVDSITATPRWMNLLTSELSLRSLTLIRPHLEARRDSGASWNLSRALQPTKSSSEAPIDLTFAEITIRNGQVTTARKGPAPSVVKNNWLFDYTRTRVRNVSLRASARRRGSQGVIEILDASFVLDDLPLRVSTLRGRLRRQRGTWELEELALSLDETRISAEASLQPSVPTTNQPSVDLKLDRSVLAHDELRRLVPRFPLEGSLTVEGEIEGSLERLRFDGVTVTRNTSFATLDGSISDLTSATRIDVTLPKSRFELSDVRALWPDLPALPDSAISPVTLQASLRGITSRLTSPETFDLDGHLAMKTAQGAARGSLSVQRSDSLLRYGGGVETDSLALGAISERMPPGTQLSGQVEFRGFKSDRNGVRGTVDLALSSSQIGRRRLQGINGEVFFENQRARGDVTLSQPEGGTLKIRGQARQLWNQPAFSASISASNLNLASERGLLPATSLSADLQLEGRGRPWKSLTGTATLEVDSSTVTRGDRRVLLPPHTATVRLTDRSSARPRLTLDGSVGTVTIDGTTIGPPLWRAGATWGQAIIRGVQRELEKPAPPMLTRSEVPGFLKAFPMTRYMSTDRAFRPSLRRTRPLKLRMEVQLRQPEILEAWWPDLPIASEDLKASTALTISPDSLHASGQLSAATLQHGATKASNVSAEYEVAARTEVPFAEAIQTTLRVSAPRATVTGVSLKSLSTSLTYGNRNGTLHLRTDSTGAIGALRATGELHIGPATNELQIQRLAVGVQGKRWRNPSPASVRIYSDALEVTPLSVTQPHPQDSTLQRIRLEGWISPSPTSLLSLTADNIYLPPFSRGVQTPWTVGGNLSGQTYLHGSRATPKIETNVSIQRLSFDRRLLGTLHLRTKYSATSPDLQIQGTLDSLTTPVDSLSAPNFVSGGVKTVEPNDLEITGRIRLPEWAHSPPVKDSQIPEGETFDLSAEIGRADLFFFEYIFEERVANVRGSVQGNLRIGGRFRNPIFDARLRVTNGAFELPRFGLKYKVRGPVGVDYQGIHLQDLSVADDQGTATVQGDILFNRYEYFSFDLSGTLDGLTVMNVSRAEDLPFYGHIRASGPVRLTGPLPDATLRSEAARTTPDSELSIPVYGATVENTPGFLVFADSTGQVPDFDAVSRRENILADRPEGEPTFVQGINIDLNVIAPEGSTVNLVFDPVVGDIVTAVGSGRVQLQRKEGNFQVFGDFNATSGTYLFTAGEVFVRRFSINEGTISWDGDPINAQLDLNAEYRTRASTSGLPGAENYRGRIPVTIQLDIDGRVSTPQVDLSLALDRDERGTLVGSETLDPILNQPGLQTEYATSVLLTNTFLLTTESLTRGGGQQSPSENRLTTAGNQLAFNSVSQLVSSQLNRYLGAALPNVDLNFGVQGENPNDLDLIYGVALRLLNERLVIRGEGIYTGEDPGTQQAQGPRGEFVVEFHLSRTVSANLFYRRKGEELTQNRTLTSTRGMGLSYETEFPTWMDLFGHLFGWLIPSNDSRDPQKEPLADESTASDSTQTRGGN